MRRIFQLLTYLGILGVILGIFSFKETPLPSFMPTAIVSKRHLQVEIKTIGELEAARSLIIASSIKGDQGKIIDLIPDGLYVNPGDCLVKLDPTPFEEKVEKFKGKIKEQQAYITILEQALEWELSQCEHKKRTAAYEVETAQLELEKIVHGDGPQEISRLKGAMQKAWLKFEELNAYSSDLLELEKQGFLNTTEIKQAQKRLSDEQEAYEMVKLQYESYVQHVYPMQVKKGETQLKRMHVNEEEVSKAGSYNVTKARALLDQAKQELADYALQLRDAGRELAQTEIHAPAAGMVVHREDYRNGQKRKPRVGDILVKNQPLIDLPDLASMMVKTRVREVDLFKVGIGKKATIEVDAYPELVFQGTISSIGVLALGEYGRGNEEKFFEVRIALNQSDPRLRPGMTTRATIHAQEVEEALTIPLHAVFDEHKHTFCYLSLPERQYEKCDIKLGISNEQWVEVKEGLVEGATVCLLNPYH